MIELIREVPPLVLAVAPFASLLAIREFWSRKRLLADLRAQEERAHVARREAMRAQQQALAAAEASKKTRAEFLSRMSHELRTPLNAVIGFSRVLEMNKAGNQRPEDIQLLARVQASGQQLLTLIDALLDQSKIESGELAMNVTLTSVVDVAARVAKHFRRAAHLKGLHMLTVLPREAATIPLDERRFEQVLEHLVDNAVKFTQTGEVCIAVATDAATGKPTRVVIADSGIGIPADRVSEIFQPFEQVDASARRRYGGAGLGLPLASRLCEAMGCQLSVESELGKGSRFAIRFPRSS